MYYQGYLIRIAREGRTKMCIRDREETGRNGKKLRSPWEKGERSRENSRNRGDGAGLGHGACFKIRESPDWSPATA